MPRVYEKMLTRVQAAVENAPGAAPGDLRAGALRPGRRRLAAVEAREAAGVLPEAQVPRSRTGSSSGRSRPASEGGSASRSRAGAPLSHDVAAFFWAAGVEVYEGYGLTETSPVLACNRPGEWRLGTVGRAIPGVTLRIAPDGEVLAKGPSVMDGGYWRKTEETASVFDADGWFLTGDIGSFDDDGFLTLTDRKKEILINAYGKNIAPAPIEAALKAVRFVSSAVLIGDRQKFLSALIVPNFEKLEGWAAARPA